MDMRVDDVNENEGAATQAGAAAGVGYTNYQDWANIKQDLELAGVESTGTYNGDKELRIELERQVDEFLEQSQIDFQEQDFQVHNGVEESAKNDREQEIKANIANATSSMIMADYMKYYHLMS